MAKIVKSELRLEIGNLLLVDRIDSVSEDESTYQELEVSDGASDSSVNFGGVTTGDVLYIESDYAISYRLASSGTSIGVDAGGRHLLQGTSFTSLLLSNSSGSTATVKILIAGT